MSSTVTRGRQTLPLNALAVVCTFVLAGIMVAGLWPFHSPLNDVAWQQGTDGLVFGEYGTVLSSAAFTTFGTGGNDSWSLELWMLPDFHHNSETFLSFSSKHQPLQFLMYRFQRGIVLQGEALDQHNNNTKAAAYIPDVLTQGRLSFITITSGVGGTTVYLNGVRFDHKSYFRPLATSLDGQIVVGNSSIENDSARALFKGLALYDQALTDEGAIRHYKSWEIEGRPDIRPSEGIVALYLFNERHGNIVHDYGRSGVDLSIPRRYTILREKVLDPPWNEFHADWGYLKDLLINVGGFVPLGFFFYAYWLATRRFGPIVIATVVLGFLVSLTIEVGQSHLPTRDSGVTDLITNTFGTYVGVALYRWTSRPFRWALNRIRGSPLPPEADHTLRSWVS